MVGNFIYEKVAGVLKDNGITALNGTLAYVPKIAEEINLTEKQIYGALTRARNHNSVLRIGYWPMKSSIKRLWTLNDIGVDTKTAEEYIKSITTGGIDMKITGSPQRGFKNLMEHLNTDYFSRIQRIDDGIPSPPIKRCGESLDVKSLERLRSIDIDTIPGEWALFE